MVFYFSTDDHLSAKYKKPVRPCPFCLKYCSKLTRHIRLCHNDQKTVIQATKLSPQERVNIFAQLRRDGIKAANNVRSKTGGPLLTERKQFNPQAKIMSCGYCNANINKNYIKQHIERCSLNYETAEYLPPQPVLALPADINKAEEEFITKFRPHMRDDDITELCFTDKLIRTFGRFTWQACTQTELHLATGPMRLLANFVKKFVCLEAEASCGEDIFLPHKFASVEEAIKLSTMNEDGAPHNSSRAKLGYHIRQACKYMKGFYLDSREEQKAKNVETFSAILELYWPNIIGKAQRESKMARQLLHLKPAALPSDDDLKILRDYTISQIRSFEDPYLHWSSNTFIALRNLLLSRVLLFNARRGGEPSRLTISDWNSAKSNEWLSSAAQQTASESDMSVIKNFKLAQLVGKTSLVPLLIPEDCWKGIDFLTDDEHRKQCGVSTTNIYVFASTEDKESRARGWDAVNTVVTKIKGRLKEPQNITATKQRHRAATGYASLDMNSAEKEAFLRHMGHTKDVSRQHYQCPQGLLETGRVGRFFTALDQGTVAPGQLGTISGLNIENQG